MVRKIFDDCESARVIITYRGRKEKRTYHNNTRFCFYSTVTLTRRNILRYVVDN